MTAARLAEKKPSIRAARAKLLDLDAAWVADLTIVVAEHEIPEVVIFNGDPFLLDPASGHLDGECLFYQQVRPFRADIGA